MTTTTPFPLFDLSLLPFETFFKYLGTSEKIYLSQCSKFAENVVQDFADDKPTKLDVYIEKDHARIIMKPGSFKEFSWKLTMDQETLLDEFWQFSSRRIFGTNWKVAEESRYEVLSVPEEGRFEKDVLQVVKILQKLFNCKISNVSLDFTGNLNFRRLLVGNHVLHTAKSVRVETHQSTRWEMLFMLDNFTASEFIFTGTVEEGFYYPKPWNFERIRISNATWIDMEQLRRITEVSKSVVINKTTLISQTELAGFVDYWMSRGTNREFNTMCEYSCFKVFPRKC